MSYADSHPDIIDYSARQGSARDAANYVERKEYKMHPWGNEPCEMVSLAHIGGKLCELPRSPWPLKLGKPTESLARLHKRGCFLKDGCGRWHSKADTSEFLAAWRLCEKSGAHDCTCPQWFKWLKTELRKEAKQ